MELKCQRCCRYNNRETKAEFLVNGSSYCKSCLDDIILPEEDEIIES